MIKKANIGDPCTHCGTCCRARICYNGAYVMKLVDELGKTLDEPCPALVKRGDEYFCGIILYPNKYLKNSKYPAAVVKRNFSKLIGSGIGCDELGDDYTQEEERKLDELLNRAENDPQWVKDTKIALRVIHEIG